MSLTECPTGKVGMYLSPHADLGVSEGIKAKDGVVIAAPAKGRGGSDTAGVGWWKGSKVVQKGRRLEAHMFADSSGENEEYT